MTDPQKIRGLPSRVLDLTATLFAETGKPLHAWRVYRWLRRVRRPLTEWLLGYFDQCAERLDRINPTSPQQHPKPGRRLEQLPWIRLISNDGPGRIRTCDNTVMSGAF